MPYCQESPSDELVERFWRLYSEWERNRKQVDEVRSEQEEE